MEQLVIQEKKGPNYALLELTGPVTSYNFAEFEKMAYDFIQKSHLVLDMSQVTAMDSSALSVLMGCFNDGAKKGFTLFLLKPSDAVMDALASTGFADSFRRIYSVTEIV
ncbi:STAS domain-containing protein [Treponema lecithinolyticum]|jgi:Anti-anti-sigma regulatory factor (antagonist of anti-sigma factor)|uniref:STAS domain protein n=1 Tax=Treponema lecithinolyticum ATCC 700332 TaxID=1321815 RepID=A0ABN0P0W8_TRELE|nr:STAS domain-containing protein [Treponema lecithinolyticum]ERJ94094.1 STAS domain protein [Treponema lecithinolyticum ATCC 700332]